MKTYFVTLNGEELAVQVNSHYSMPAKLDGPPEQCYPAEGEVDWDLLDEDGLVDPVAFDELTREQEDEIERQLWEQLDQEDNEHEPD